MQSTTGTAFEELARPITLATRILWLAFLFAPATYAGAAYVRARGHTPNEVSSEILLTIYSASAAAALGAWYFQRRVRERAQERQGSNQADELEAQLQSGRALPAQIEKARNLPAHEQRALLLLMQCQTQYILSWACAEVPAVLGWIMVAVSHDFTVMLPLVAASVVLTVAARPRLNEVLSQSGAEGSLLARTLTLVLLAIGVSAPDAGADDAVKRDYVGELLSLTHHDAIIRDAETACLNSGRALTPEMLFEEDPTYFAGLTPESDCWPEIERQHRDYYETGCRYVDRDALIAAEREKLATDLTDAELAEIVAFFESPAGRKYAAANLAASRRMNDVVTNGYLETYKEASVQASRDWTRLLEECADAWATHPGEGSATQPDSGHQDLRNGAPAGVRQARTGATLDER